MSGLTPDVIEKIRKVFNRFPDIEKVLLYGSRAKGCEKRGSDIDLCFFGSTLTEELLYQIREKLDDLFLPYSFDLSLYEQIENPDLLSHIDRVGIVFYEKSLSPPDTLQN